MQKNINCELQKSIVNTKDKITISENEKIISGN